MRLEMNESAACALINVAIVSAIAWAVYLTGTAWPLWALLCMCSTNSDKDKSL